MLIEITGDNPYPSGGSPITAATLKVNSILAILPQEPYPLADRWYIWDRTNGKLMCQVISTAAEAGAIDLSADRIVAVVIAR
jgi:hypothetical protein